MEKNETNIREKTRELIKKYCNLKIKKSRDKGNTIITRDMVINGLKFIVENRSIEHIELVDGLLKLNCNFSMDDIDKQFKNMESIDKITMEDGIGICARLIAAVRDSELSRRYIDGRFLHEDNKGSMYNIIRILTGDDGYTKEYVDSLNKSDSLKKCHVK